MATRGRPTAQDPDLWGRPEPLYPLVLPVIDLLVRALFRVEVHGADNLPRRGPLLLAANHVSYLDPGVLATVGYRAGRRIRFLALSDLFAKPGLGWLLRAGRMIPVHRGRGAEPMLRDARAALEAGEAVLIYPEGTIPAPGVTVEAQGGAGLLALGSSAPVVPVGSWGLERGRSRMPPVRRRAVVVFGEPLDLAHLRVGPERAAGREAASALLEAVRECALEARRRA